MHWNPLLSILFGISEVKYSKWWYHLYLIHFWSHFVIYLVVNLIHWIYNLDHHTLSTHNPLTVHENEFETFLLTSNRFIWIFLTIICDKNPNSPDKKTIEFHSNPLIFTFKLIIEKWVRGKSFNVSHFLAEIHIIIRLKLYAMRQIFKLFKIIVTATFSVTLMSMFIYFQTHFK